MNKFKILYASQSSFEPELTRSKLYSKLPEGFELELLIDKHTEAELLDCLHKAHFMMGWPRTITTEKLVKMSNLKMVQLLSAGYDYFPVNKATQLGIPVATNAGANAVSVAEHTILLILGVYKKIYKYVYELNNGVFYRANDHPLTLYELSNKKVGIIGFGNIGKSLAKCLMGFTNNIYYYDIIRYKKDEKKLRVEYLPLNDLLKSSDIVSLHVPLKKSTKKMIGENELNLMKNTAIIINTSRGEIINEEALYNALKKNKIAGAGLDVFLNEDEFKNGKYRISLLDCRNVLITPHYAGHTYEAHLRRIDIGYENIIRVTKNEKPKYVINKEVFARADRLNNSYE